MDNMDNSLIFNLTLNGRNTLEFNLTSRLSDIGD